MKLIFRIFLLFAVLLIPSGAWSQSLRNPQMNGYMGIWFELNQKYPYGDKYSGGLGTYTADHKPMAIYAGKVNKTFFVYGGTTREDQRHLLCMIGCYDHTRHRLQKPVVVCDKEGVNDPHDNPSLQIDGEGHLWVFVSGRGKIRQGFKYRSVKPYDISSFEKISTEEMTYPQPWYFEGKGFLHLFTKYTGVRELYFETSADGVTWSEDRKLAGIREGDDKLGGHYQISQQWQNKVGTFFNRHPNGDVDRRTDLYYLETADMGQTWTSASGQPVAIPLTAVEDPATLTEVENPVSGIGWVDGSTTPVSGIGWVDGSTTPVSGIGWVEGSTTPVSGIGWVEGSSTTVRVINYRDQGLNVYLCEMDFDDQGNPVCLYVTSRGHQPGPGSAPYIWRTTRWNGTGWESSVVGMSDHNYDMGSLYIYPDKWLVVAPLVNGPQLWGAGGEVAMYQSTDNGKTWIMARQVTINSPRNNGYVRRPLNARDPFLYYWADGNPHQFGISKLYFGDSAGNVFEMPYDFTGNWVKPMRVKR